MPEPIRYTVRIPSPITHYAEVEARIPTGGAAALDLFLPVWTPGSYLIREYARHIEGLQAVKTSKNRWRVQTGGEAEVVVSYRVYCRELTVRSNFIDDRFALLNGAATFVTTAAHLKGPHEVTLVLPLQWRTSVTGLAAVNQAGASHCYLAPDYDTLVDCPILAGNPEIHEFWVEGKPHYLVNEGADGLWDVPESIAALEKLVVYNRRFWGTLPYHKFVFLNILGEGKGGGGLEHKNSLCVLASRYSMRTRQAYVGWLSLMSHEYFHVWNVKRLRPVELGPFDYEDENYSRGLWVSEGFTSYYDELILVRTGLITRDEFLTGTGPDDRSRGLSGTIEALQTTPGRLVHPVGMASYDAWIKFYRPDESTPNTTVSYYTKGAVIAFLLDAAIRESTQDWKSLDDVMRLAFKRYSGERGFTDDQFRELICEAGERDMREWLHKAVDTTEELHFVEALQHFGLRFKAVPASGKSYLGVKTKVDSGRLIVTQTAHGKQLGFAVDDEILGIGDYRVRPEQWSQRMEQFHPGESIIVLIARREKLTCVEAVLEEEPQRKWILEIREEPNEALNAWLGLPQPH